MGHRREVSVDCPAWAPQAASVTGWHSPQQGWGGWPPRSWRTLVRQEYRGQGEEAVSLCGSAWGRRACWVPLAKSEKVNDPRRKTPVLRTLPGINHCHGREMLRLSGPTVRMRTHRPLGRPGNPGQPKVSAPLSRVGSSPAVRDREWEPSLFGARVASSHPEIMRA